MTESNAAAGSEITSTPLAPRSGPRGAAMFRELTPEETGIVTENNYNDPAMWAQRYAEFATGAVGTGVAIGDYDGDGRPDLFVVSKTESCRLFRNLGNWKFADVTDQAGVGDHGAAALIWKQGATFADVNNDGWLDLHVCRFGAANLLYVNQGDGKFHEEAAARGLAIVNASVMAAFHDYDRDGWLDVFVQTNWPESLTQRHEQQNHLLRNHGDGTFADMTSRAGLSGKAQGHSAIWWDYDGDGWPDLYVANDFTPPDQLWRSHRDGTFSNMIHEVVPHLPFSSMGSDLGDVNNDGLIDLFVADMAATTHEKDQRTMANARRLITEAPVDRAAHVMRNMLFLNTGCGRMLEGGHLAGIDATDWTWSVRFEDLDNDGRVDLHVTNGMYREPHNADLMARISAAETLVQKIQLERASRLLNESNLAFRNAGDLQFVDVSAGWGLGQLGISFGTAFGDLDGDGDLDLAFTNFKRGVTVMRNDSDSGHRVLVALRGTTSNRFGVGAEVRLETAAGAQVRPLVLARGVLSSSEPVVHFGTGDETRVQRLVVTWPSGRTHTLTELETDRRYVITEPTEPATVAAEVAEVYPVVTPQFIEMTRDVIPAWDPPTTPVPESDLPRLMPLRLNRHGPSLAAGDLNGDGIADLVVGGAAGERARLLLGNDRGAFRVDARFAPAADDRLPDGPWAIFDANGDGANDLLQTKSGDARPAGASEYQPILYLNTGHGTWQPAPRDGLPPFPSSVGAVAVADVDGSGRRSLFLGGRVVPGDYPLPPCSVLLLNRGGRFEDVTDALAPGLRQVGMVTAALWSDVDGDSWLDLMLATEWGGVRCWRNPGRGERFDDWSDTLGFASAGAGWWRSFASADFNGDGRPDFVAGNLGLNTPYRASADQPARLFRGEFGDRAEPALIEAYSEGDRLLPRRARLDLGAVIPEILRRFPRTDFFARATLPEIVGDERLSAAQCFAATELRSGVLLSRPGGEYRFVAFPRVAQIAPIQAMVARDFDGDGHADVLAMQNSDEAPAAIGRFHGGLGLLLRGDGRGEFVAVPARESGVIVSGATATVVDIDANGDGWLDFVVSRHRRPLMFFRNAASGLRGRGTTER